MFGQYAIVWIGEAGMYPSVAEFNGFYTLGAYLNNYSLSYKLQFREIIVRELDKNAALRGYFDGWGNRCYVFSSELGDNELCSESGHYVLHNLELNTAQLRSMGGEYVISAAYIENSDRHGLRLEKVFTSNTSFWELYLYYVLPLRTAQPPNSSEVRRPVSKGTRS